MAAAVIATSCFTGKFPGITMVQSVPVYNINNNNNNAELILSKVCFEEDEYSSKYYNKNR